MAYSRDIALGSHVTRPLFCTTPAHTFASAPQCSKQELSAAVVADIFTGWTPDLLPSQKMLAFNIIDSIVQGLGWPTEVPRYYFYWHIQQF